MNRLPDGGGYCPNDPGNAPVTIDSSVASLGLGGSFCCPRHPGGGDQSVQINQAANPEYRPFPNVGGGELIVDPQIRFQGQKFDLNFDFVYGSKQTENAEAGNGWASYIRARVLSQTGDPESFGVVTVSRGGYVDGSTTRRDPG